MESFSGKKAVRFLREFMLAKRQLSLRIAKTDTAWLTIIVDLPLVGDRRYLVVDRIKGLFEIARGPDPSFVFECVDEKKIQYHFEAKLLKMGPEKIWFSFPLELVRVQRRESFRLDVPSGCKARIRIGEEIHTFIIKDVSIGGIALLIEPGRGIARLLEKAETVEDVTLYLAIGESTFNVFVESAHTIGFDYEHGTKYRVCRLRFEEMNAESQKALRDYIYKLERYNLRKVKENA